MQKVPVGVLIPKVTMSNMNSSHLQNQVNEGRLKQAMKEDFVF